MIRRTFHRNFYSLFGRDGGFRFRVLTLSVLISGVVGVLAKVPTDFKIEEHLKRVNKPATKTMQSEDGDIVDCVDIYKQPAFDHPLLQNHTIEMRPSFLPKVLEVANSSDVIAQQLWQKSGSCPDGTIPIRRTQKSDLLRAMSLEGFGVNAADPNCKLETSGAWVFADYGDVYYGISSQINVWGPFVVDKEWSLSSVAMQDKEDLVESGYGIRPILFGDNKPRIYANWRSGDNGCYNLECSGFVQVSNRLMLGACLHPISTYNGRQYVAPTSIYKDNAQQKWWLMMLGEVVGYWPQALFSQFQRCTQLSWLGRVCDSQTKGLHTTTAMGNGHWPNEGFSRSAYFRNMLVIIDQGDKFRPPKFYDYSSMARGCYGVKKWYPKGDEGPGFFYGGPGGACCDGRCK